MSLYILSWLTLERLSFFLKVIEEIRPGLRNQQRSVMSIINVNLSEKVLGGTHKYGLLEQKSSLVCGFKKMVDQGILLWKLLLVKCSQALIKLSS